MRSELQRLSSIGSRVVSGARLFPASCDGRNVLAARVTDGSLAIAGELRRFPQVEQWNRIPQPRTECARDRIPDGHARVNSDGNAALSECARRLPEEVRAADDAPPDFARLRAQRLRLETSTPQIGNLSRRVSATRQSIRRN